MGLVPPLLHGSPGRRRHGAQRTVSVASESMRRFSANFLKASFLDFFVHFDE